MNPRTRPIWIAAVVIVAAWTLAAIGYSVIRNSRMTAGKLRDYALSIDLNKLTGDARAEAIRKFAQKLNALPPEERRRARVDRIANNWFEQMTEEEKGGFIEATMPTGFKQMIASFEQLPEARRRRAIDDAVRRMKEAQERNPEEGESTTEGGTNQPPALSPELREKVVKLGLKSYYSESSAQSKAEMAPMLEELQRMMESGRMFRGRP